MASRGMVSAGHYLAAWWGTDVLRRGGNAADAGVAAGLALNVVHNDMASLSGVVALLYREAEGGAVHSVAGVGPWPAAFDVEDLRRQDQAGLLPGAAQTVVPAAADAWITTLARFGTMSWRDVSSYPLELASRGVPVHHFMSQNIALHLDGYLAWPENERIFLHDGAAPAPGTVLVQEDLAATLSDLQDAESVAARAGADRTAALEASRARFYEGDIADKLVRHYRELGSPLGTSDMAEFRSSVEAPVSIEAFGCTLWGCGSWSQGPVLLMALNVLRAFDLARLRPDDAGSLHLVVEALKLAFSDLEAHCGDPEFVDVPLQALVDPAYGRLRARLVDPERAIPGVPPYGDPIRGMADAGTLPDALRSALPDGGEPDTSYVAVMDVSGNVFSATPSDSYFSNPIVPGLGIHASRRGAQSRIDPWYPNVAAPGKRPRLTPNPVLLTRDGAPYMAMGTPGTNVQPQAMLQVLLRTELFGMAPQQAVEAPRVASYSFPQGGYPFAYEPGLLQVEEDLTRHVRDGLADRGHRVEIVPASSWKMGGVCLVRRDPATGVMWAAADPRREAYSVGF